MSPPPALGRTVELPGFQRRPATGAAISLTQLSICIQQQRVGRHGRPRQAAAALSATNDLPRLLADLAPSWLRGGGIHLQLVLLVDDLIDHGYALHLVNTTAIPQYDGLKHGDDDSDALRRAQLMRLGLLP
jgi:hypothetical protein